MAIYIRDISINSFRGISNLEINGLRDVNIIAGNNNAGKTSILEAIALLRNTHSFYNVLKVARMREGVFAKTSMYENFMSMFPGDHSYIDVAARLMDDTANFMLYGEQRSVIYEGKPGAYNKKYGYVQDKMIGTEIAMFKGKLRGLDFMGIYDIPIEYTPMSRTNEFKKIPDQRNIVYVPPGAHLQENVFNKIVRNDYYKEICIRLIQLFDEGIVDLLYLSNELTMKAVEYVKHKELGIMPLSTYGDGIKRVLSLANSIASAAGGILMIDEVETSINHKYYNDIFGFLIKACRQYDVQMFITTHNIEAIDAILKTQGYEYNVDYDPISVLTFRKDRETMQVRSRNLSGKEVFENREKFGFEVRL